MILEGKPNSEILHILRTDSNGGSSKCGGQIQYVTRLKKLRSTTVTLNWRQETFRAQPTAIRLKSETTESTR